MKKLYDLYLSYGPEWKKIAKSFKFRNPNSICKLFNRTNWETFLEKENLSFTVDGVEKITKCSKNNKEEAEGLISKKQEKIKNEAEIRRIRYHLEEIAKKNYIIEKIISSITKVPEVKPLPIPKIKTKHSPQESFLLLSDCHVGLSVIPEEVGGIGEYNKEIFKRRLKNLIDTVCRITDLHRKTHQLDVLHVPILGDIVHGGNDIGKWGFLHLEQNVMDQVFEVLSVLPQALLTLSQIYKQVHVYGVVGNHGRTAKRNIEKNYVNWDYLIYKWMEAQLVNQKNIDFVIPKSSFHIAESLGQKFLLTHGSMVRSWNQLPWYGLNRAESKFRNMIDGTKNMQKMWKEAKNRGINFSDPQAMADFAFKYNDSFQYMICGHFHQMGEVETNSGGRIILNSSFIGGDDYSINDLLCSSKPSQKFFGVNKDRKTWSYDIDLER